jgi:phospholipase C
MSFAYRSHKAFVNLDPGDALHYALPPMTPGTLVIKAQWIRIGQTDQPGDHPGTRPGRVRDIDWVRLRNLTELTRTVPAWRASARRRPEGPLDPGSLPPEVGGDSGPPGEITFELFHGDQLVQKKVGQNIFFNVPASGHAYSLRISRAPDPNGARRRYRIDAQYSSVLPQVNRRIPMAFLQQGFDRNWNTDQSYLEMFRIENQLLQYRWSYKLSALYDVQREKIIRFIDTDLISFPAILAKTLKIYAGHENRVPSLTTKQTPFFAIRLELECINSTTIDGPGPANINLPRQMWVELRLYLEHLGGIIMYDPEIRTSWASVLDNLSGWLVDKIKEGIRGLELDIHRWQWKEDGNYFDAIMRPWMVGYYEVIDLEYEQATDEIVIWYVGKPVERPSTTAPEPTTSSGWTNLTKLFDTADDEKWAPSTPPLGGGEPLHRTDPGNLAKINHIIILMQENRSFDQIFGYLSRDGHPELGVQQEVEGLLPGNNARDINEYQFSPISDPHKFRSRAISDTSWPFALNNPCHGRDCVKAQITAGMKHFVGDYARRLGADATVENLQRIMDYYAPAALPVYTALAREFAICDHWFCSHIGGTLPNRHITLSGDLNIDRYGLPEEDNSHFRGYAPSERLTFFDHLTQRNVSWRLFEHGYSFLRLYRNFTFDISRIVAFDDAVRGFEAAAELDELPSVSFIEPNYIELPDGDDNDDHAPADMHNGQRLIARIVRALVNGGQWNKSMLIITYDEHGGFYDHLVPPSEIEDLAGGGTARPIPPLANGVTQLGPRVPALVISPLIPRGQGKVNVASKVYEHTSIVATILRCFCSPYPPKISPRVEAANDLRDVLTLDADDARPSSDFASLLQVLEPVATSAVRRDPAARPVPVPTRKIADPMDDEFREDFHGFMAFASAVTGRSG